MNPGRRVKVFALMLAGVLAGPVHAQGPADIYPTKLVTLIVPYAAGGNTELEARLYAQKLGESLGRPVVLDFKPSAGTTVGTAYVAKAPPDGHTLLTISSAFATAPAFYKDLPYDPVKDIAPVSLMNKRTIVFLLNPSLPFKNIAEYVAFARANPGTINFATSGAGGAASGRRAIGHGDQYRGHLCSLQGGGADGDRPGGRAGERNLQCLVHLPAADQIGEAESTCDQQH